MKVITLNNGMNTLVSDIDYNYLNQWKWKYNKNGYAARKYEVRGVTKNMMMHRLIINAQPGQIVDHIDRNPLNNTRTNLRIVDNYGSSHNTGKRTGTKYQYKGVQYLEQTNTWESRCKVYGINYYLGTYKTEIAAAYAYNKKIMELSEYACPNELNLSIDELEQMLINDKTKPIDGPRSEHKGISWCNTHQDWVVQLPNNGKQLYIGRFKNEDDAIIALTEYTEYANQYPLETVKQMLIDGRVKRLPPVRQYSVTSNKESSEFQSKYNGIHWDTDKNRWRVRPYINGKRVNLGSYINESDAIAAIEAYRNSNPPS